MEAGNKANLECTIHQYWLIVGINWQLSTMFKNDTLRVFQLVHGSIYISSKIAENVSYFCRRWRNYLIIADVKHISWSLIHHCITSCSYPSTRYVRKRLNCQYVSVQWVVNNFTCIVVIFISADKMYRNIIRSLSLINFTNVYSVVHRLLLWNRQLENVCPFAMLLFYIFQM